MSRGTAGSDGGCRRNQGTCPCHRCQHHEIPTRDERAGTMTPGTPVALSPDCGAGHRMNNRFECSMPPLLVGQALVLYDGPAANSIPEGAEQRRS